MRTNKDWSEKFLRKYEEDANKILHAHKSRRDEILNYHGKPLRSEGLVALNIAINEMLNYPAKLSPEDEKKVKDIRRARICREIVDCCNHLRTSVRQNNLRQIVYDTEALVSLSFNAGFLKTESSILRSKRGGQREKKEHAFFPLVEYAWQNSKRKTCLSMWKFLIKKLTTLDIGGRNMIEGLDFVYEKKTNKITLYFGDERKRPRDMGFRTFERYVRDFKEELKKDPQ